MSPVESIGLGGMCLATALALTLSVVRDIKVKQFGASGLRFLGATGFAALGGVMIVHALLRPLVE